MKKRIPTFLAGMATMALIGGLSVSALAASGAMTINVNPINVQVNGQTFAPKDTQGNSVPVFSYNGTTYAPLRALAEAYGLDVGYDAEKNMATVGEVGSSPVDATTPNTPVVPVGNNDVSDVEPWTLVVNGERYTCDAVFYQGQTCYSTSALIKSCPDNLYNELTVAIGNAKTVNVNGVEFVVMHDISEFFRTHAPNSAVHVNIKEYVIEYKD